MTFFGNTSKSSKRPIRTPAVSALSTPGQTASALLARHLDSGGPSVHVNTLVAKLKASGLVCKRTRYSLKKAAMKTPFAKQP